MAGRVRYYVATATTRTIRQAPDSAELARRLNEHGMEETEGAIGAKLARGTFPVAFFLACLAVLGITALALADL